MITLFVFLSICAFFFPVSFKRKIRYRKVIRIRNARREERYFGGHFRDIALERSRERCLVFARHHPWPGGYQIRLTWLGEPDDIITVRINCSLKKGKRIEIEECSQRKFFSLDRESFDQATREFERSLGSLISV